MRHEAKLRRGLVAAVVVLSTFGSIAMAAAPGDIAAGNAVTSDAEITIALKPDVPNGYPDRVGRFIAPLRQDITSMKLTPRGNGHFDVTFLTPEKDVPGLVNIDFRPYVPRMPAFAEGNPTLSFIALVQRELGRNQTRYDMPEGYGACWIANNCLKNGLWEIGIDRQDDKGWATVYHAWFEFPQDVYADLFQQVNGVPYPADKITGYPHLAGIPIPLDELRAVQRETQVKVDTHLDKPIAQLPEQSRKQKLIVTPGITTYGDFVAAKNQPIAVAKFSEPGFYDNADPIKADLSWLASPTGAVQRTVKLAGASGATIPEVEITFANGYRLILGDAGLATLPARTEAPKTESDVLRDTFGICTQDLYASQSERSAEFENPRPCYLLLLDKAGNHLDNHSIGIDRTYTWRDSSDHLHIYAVGYERIALVSHLTMPWTAK